ncbi:unnamed protein product [Effrenium voratum]|uniref:Pentatricopeptide repeat-containing protein, chloroplastic n=2 Tax=Effrenium voratum TaxID=2562239 RepID=A0AA36I1B7_9DINO|nr:unnamed protein product [Effrenium voratum]
MRELLAACGDAQQWQQALVLLLRLAASQLQDVVLCNMAISTCARAARWREALGLLALPATCGLQASVVTQNAAMDACQKAEEWQKALELFTTWRVARGRSSAVSFGIAMSALELGRCHWRLVMRMLTELTDSLLEANTVIYNAAMDACCAAQGWQQALHLLKEVKKRRLRPDSFTASAAMRACQHSQQWLQALQLLRGFVLAALQLDIIACNSAISTCARAARWREALGLLALPATCGLQASVVTQNAAMDACQKAEEWQKALELFTTWRVARGGRSSAVSFGIAMSALELGRCHWRQVMSLAVDWPVANKMVLRECPWARGWTLLESLRQARTDADVLGQVASEWQDGAQTWRGALDWRWNLWAMARQGQVSTVVCNSAAFGCAEWQTSLRLLELVARPTVVTFGTAVGALERLGRWRRCAEVLGALRGSLQPNEVTYGASISACGKGQQWAQALSLSKDLIGAGLRQSLISANAVSAACERRQKWVQCLSLVFQQPHRDRISYDAVLAACSGAWRRALQLWQEFRGRALQATVATFNMVITACEAGAKWELALALLQQLTEEGLTGSIVSYTAVISACSKCARWQEAILLLAGLDRRGVEANVITYQAAASACGVRPQGAQLLWEMQQAVEAIRLLAVSGQKCACFAVCVLRFKFDVLYFCSLSQVTKNLAGVKDRSRTTLAGWSSIGTIDINWKATGRPKPIALVAVLAAAMAWPTGARWGRGQTGPERQKVQTKLQRKLPIRADAAGLLQLHPRAPFRSVRLLVEPQLKEWKWNPDLAAHVLKTLAMHSQARTATQTLQVMRCNEVTPLAAHYNAALAACRKLRRSQMAELLLKFMRQDQVLPNDDTVGEALRCGSWEWALQLWQTLRDPKLTVASHNHAMAVLQPEPNLALQVFEELKTWQLAPDADSFVQGITAVGALGDWQRSLDLLQSMRRRDLAPAPTKPKSRDLDMDKELKSAKCGAGPKKNPDTNPKSGAVGPFWGSLRWTGRFFFVWQGVELQENDGHAMKRLKVGCGFDDPPGCEAFFGSRLVLRAHPCPF